jgi:uncharacterized membrane protein HdeD (DUF308 family)
MFRELRFYDHYTSEVTSPWGLFLALGLNFILLGLLIILFPELLAWLAGGFLFLNGMLLLGVAWKYRRFKRRHRRWRDEWWLP